LQRDRETAALSIDFSGLCHLCFVLCCAISVPNSRAPVGDVSLTDGAEPLTEITANSDRPQICASKS
jgi:hypothetical protein